MTIKKKTQILFKKQLFLSYLNIRELSQKPFEERCYYLEILKSRYYPQKQREIDGTTYVGYEGSFVDYLGGSIDSDNEFANKILNENVFIPAIDDIANLVSEEEVDLRRLSCKAYALTKTTMYVPDDCTFPGIDYFSCIYLIDLKKWLFLGRQAKQAVKNLTSLSTSKMNQYVTSLKKLIFQDQSSNDSKASKSSKVTLTKDELFFCLLLSPKHIVSTWHPDTTIAKQMVWMNDTCLTRFFGPQFDLTMRSTMTTAGGTKQKQPHQVERQTFTFGDGGIVDIRVVSNKKDKNCNNKNKNKNKDSTQSDEDEEQDMDVMLDGMSMTRDFGDEMQDDIDDNDKMEDYVEPQKKKRKLNSGNVANDKK